MHPSLFAIGALVLGIALDLPFHVIACVILVGALIAYFGGV